MPEIAFRRIKFNWQSRRLIGNHQNKRGSRASVTVKMRVSDRNRIFEIRRGMYELC